MIAYILGLIITISYYYFSPKIETYFKALSDNKKNLYLWILSPIVFISLGTIFFTCVMMANGIYDELGVNQPSINAIIIVIINVIVFTLCYKAYKKRINK